MTTIIIVVLCLLVIRQMLRFVRRCRLPVGLRRSGMRHYRFSKVQVTGPDSMMRHSLAGMRPEEIDAYIADLPPEVREYPRDFNQHLLPGDEVWAFRSPQWTWRSLCGRQGYVALRNGEVVHHKLTVMS